MEINNTEIKNKLSYFDILLIVYFLATTIIGTLLPEDYIRYYINLGFIIVNPTDLLYFVAIIYIGFKSYTKMSIDDRNDRNVKVFRIIIFIYCLYQILFILPMSYYENEGTLSLVNNIRSASNRLFLLFILFFYWKTLNDFKNIDRLILLISLSSIILFVFHVSNYLTGNYVMTETGNYRYGHGTGVLFYGFSFINSLAIVNKKRNKYILLFVSLLGIILLAHRSGFFAIIFILIIALLVKKINIKVLFSFVILTVIIFIISQISGLWEDFMGRFFSTDLNSGNMGERIKGWKYGIEIFSNTFLNGIMFNDLQYSNSLSHNADFVNIFHNFIMQILVSEGIIGLAFHSVILYYIYKIALKNFKDTITYQMILSITFYLFYSLFNVVYSSPTCFFFLVIPTAIILYRNKELNYINK